MKLLMPFLMIALAGCQATPAPVVAPPPAAVNPPLSKPPFIPATDAALERKVRQQAQYIEALISQNEALVARSGSNSQLPAYPSPVARSLGRPFVSDVTPAAKPTEGSLLTPNAEGLIDVAAALVAPRPDEAVNPFAVRSVPPESVREVSLQVGGIVAGPVACAVINDKLVQIGDAIESLAVERIESDAVILKHGTQRMRLPIGGKNLRVRLPL